MNPCKKKTCTCDELIQILMLDPYYGIKHSRDVSGKVGVEDPNSRNDWLVREKPLKTPNGNTKENEDKKECPEWENSTARAVFYKTDSENTKAILNSIYEGRPSRQKFKSKFKGLPCKSDLLRHLVYSWCGILGLPYSKNGHSPENQETDILDNWTEDFEIKLEDLKIFLRNHYWPLPVFIFDYEPDNTFNKVNLTSQEFDNIFLIKVELQTQLQQELEELKKIQPNSIDEQERKTKKVDRLEAEIQTIVSSEITSDKRISADGRQAERSIETQTRYMHWNRQYKEIKRKNPDKSDVWISKQIAKHQEGGSVPSETIRRRMKTK